MSQNGFQRSPWRHLGHPLGALGTMLGASGSSWDAPWSSWGVLWELGGGLWEVLGIILGALWDDVWDVFPSTTRSALFSLLCSLFSSLFFLLSVFSLFFDIAPRHKSANIHCKSHANINRACAQRNVDRTTTDKYCCKLSSDFRCRPMFEANVSFGARGATCDINVHANRCSFCFFGNSAGNLP